MVNGDDFYASVLQKIISKNLSKSLYDLLYHKNSIPIGKNDDECVCVFKFPTSTHARFQFPQVKMSKRVNS